MMQLVALSCLVVCRMFMMVVLVVYSCMGMQLFGSQFEFPEDDYEVPRENFDNFIMSFLSLFQVCELLGGLCGDWSELLGAVVTGVSIRC